MSQATPPITPREPDGAHPAGARAPRAPQPADACTTPPRTARSVPARLPVLSTDGWLLFATCGVRSFAYGFLSVVLALYLAALGFDPRQSAPIFTAALAGGAIMTIALTTVADRLGRRRILIAGALLMALAGAVFALTDQALLLGLAAISAPSAPRARTSAPSYRSNRRSCPRPPTIRAARASSRPTISLARWPVRSALWPRPPTCSALSRWPATVRSVGLRRGGTRARGPVRTPLLGRRRHARRERPRRLHRPPPCPAACPPPALERQATISERRPCPTSVGATPAGGRPRATRHRPSTDACARCRIPWHDREASRAVRARRLRGRLHRPGPPGLLVLPALRPGPGGAGGALLRHEPPQLAFLPGRRAAGAALRPPRTRWSSRTCHRTCCWCSCRSCPACRWRWGCCSCATCCPQLDVPTRQSYTMAIIPPSQRAATAACCPSPATPPPPPPPPSPARRSPSPHLGCRSYSPGPKIVYDLTIWSVFRHVRPPEETARLAAKGG